MVLMFPFISTHHRPSLIKSEHEISQCQFDSNRNSTAPDGMRFSHPVVKIFLPCPNAAGNPQSLAAGDSLFRLPHLPDAYRDKYARHLLWGQPQLVISISIRARPLFQQFPVLLIHRFFRRLPSPMPPERVDMAVRPSALIGMFTTMPFIFPIGLTRAVLSSASTSLTMDPILKIPIEIALSRPINISPLPLYKM